MRHQSRELQDELTALYSYRHWAFVRWAEDLRRRLRGEPIFPVPLIRNRDGVVLNDKEFIDFLNQVHHIWHPNGDPAWTQATPTLTTGAG